MWHWLNSNSGFVESIGTLISAMLALITIVVLSATWRAIKRQASAAEKQAEAARALTQVATEQSRLLTAQIDTSRKQIHADRVAEIFKALRSFEHFVVHSGNVGPGKDFSEFGNISFKGGKICEQYLALQEAYYLSKLVSEPLFVYMKQRMDEADGLQRIADPEVFQKKLRDFHKSWNVYEMAERIRELS